MKLILNHKYYWCLGLTLLIIFCCFRNPANPWDRVIQAEGLGYYAYLPALFIEHDLTWNKTGPAAASYYQHDIREDFLNKIGQTGINKYFPGISFLWLPFFLPAHFFSALFHYPTDGYSLLYQYSIGIAAIFYLILGIRFCDLLLKEIFSSERIIRFSTLSIVIGSNLLYNTLGVASQSHVYSFFLLSAFLFYVIKYLKSQLPAYQHLFLALLFLSVSFCIRPTDILILLILPFLNVILKIPIKNYFLPFQNGKHFFSALAGFALPVLMTMLLWYLQTGKFIADSYVGEHFYFLKPQWVNFLFSYRKGWLVYHPIFFISLLGIFFLALRKEWFSFFSAFFFVLALVYVFSSWWIWTYSVPFGQRVMIDFYPVFAIFFALALEHSKGIIRQTIIFISILLTLFNLWRTYQYHKGIIPWEYVTSEIYFSSIRDTAPVARYLVNEPRVIHRTAIRVMPETFQPSDSSGKLIYHSALPGFNVPGIHHLRIGFNALQKENLPEAKIDLLIYSHGKTIRTESRYVNDYLRPGKSVSLTLGFELDKTENPDSLSVLFYTNASMDAVKFTSGQIELITEKGEPEFTP